MKAGGIVLRVQRASWSPYLLSTPGRDGIRKLEIAFVPFRCGCLGWVSLLCVDRLFPLDRHRREDLPYV
jgi:hypothetical protein